MAGSLNVDYAVRKVPLSSLKIVFCSKTWFYRGCFCRFALPLYCYEPKKHEVRSLDGFKLESLITPQLFWISVHQMEGTNRFSIPSQQTQSVTIPFVIKTGMQFVLSFGKASGSCGTSIKKHINSCRPCRYQSLGDPINAGLYDLNGVLDWPGYWPVPLDAFGAARHAATSGRDSFLFHGDWLPIEMKEHDIHCGFFETVHFQIWVISLHGRNRQGNPLLLKQLFLWTAGGVLYPSQRWVFLG